MHLRNKSDINIESAELLIENNFYAPSVHCSYYGVYQFSKTTLNRVGVTYENLDSQIATTKMGSHDFLIKKISETYEEKTTREDARNLKKAFKLLKTYRLESDYNNETVDHPKSNKALSISKEIISKIKKKL